MQLPVIEADIAKRVAQCTTKAGSYPMISIRFTRTKVLCSFILLMLAGLSASAGAHTASATNAIPSDRGRVLIWIGAGGDARWSNPANWEGGRVPTASDAVLISAGTSETLVDPAFGGHVASLTLDEGYTGTLTLARALNVDGPLDVRGGMVAGGGDALNAQSLQIARGAIVRLGVNGKLKLSGDGTPLTGDGVLDTTTHTPNSVECSGQAKPPSSAAAIIR